MRGGVLLHQIEKLERDGEDEGRLGRETVDIGGELLASPGQQRGEVLMAEADEHLLERTDEELEVAVDLLEAESDVIAFYRLILGHRFPLCR